MDFETLETRHTKALKIGCGALVVIFFVLFLIMSSIRFVGAGNIGVVTNFGKVDNAERGPGLNIIIPFLTDVISMDGRVQGIPFENLAAASKEYQDVFLTGVLNVHVKFDQAAELYQAVGLDYKDKIVVPFYTNIVKEVVPQYAISEVLPKREEIRKLTVTKLQDKLTPYGIIVDDVALANINFNEKYNDAIQDKQVQELRVQTEKNILEQKKIQKEQVIVQAQADAEAQVARAKGEAEANKLVAQSLTNAILMNRYIEKLSDKIQVMMVPSDGNLFINPKDFMTTP